MYEEEPDLSTQTGEKKEDKTCTNCGLRQYGEICVNCNTPIEEEVDLDKKQEDDYDEYDWRDHR